MKFKKLLSLSSLSLLLTGCNLNYECKLENLSISKNTKFGSCMVDTNTDILYHAGIKLGDSLNVKFSNGYELLDVPYFSGYYVKNNKPVVVSYPSDPYLTITYNNVGIWDSAKLNEEDTVSIYLNEGKKYLVTENALSQNYSLERKDYSSDEEFSNFRNVKVGNIKNNILYRGASSLDNSRKRAKTTDNLLKKYNINTIIDLADSSLEIENYLLDNNFNSEYTKNIIDNNNLIPLSMGSGYSLKEYKTSLVEGLRFLISKDGPFYIHCMEGKDRTGFVLFLLGALCNASYDELENDYMLTYKNYYKINKENDLDKYNSIKELYFDSFIETLLGNDYDSSFKEKSYVEYAKEYLKEGNMKEEEINELINKLTK